MTTAIMQSAQFTCQLNLTVNVNVNTDRALLLLIAVVAFVIWKLRLWTLELSLWARDIKAAIGFTSTLFTISFKSLAFGMGVRV